MGVSSSDCGPESDEVFRNWSNASIDNKDSPVDGPTRLAFRVEGRERTSPPSDPRHLAPAERVSVIPPPVSSIPANPSSQSSPPSLSLQTTSAVVVIDPPNRSLPHIQSVSEGPLSIPSIFDECEKNPLSLDTPQTVGTLSECELYSLKRASPKALGTPIPNSPVDYSVDNDEIRSPNGERNLVRMFAFCYEDDGPIGSVNASVVAPLTINGRHSVPLPLSEIRATDAKVNGQIELTVDGSSTTDLSSTFRPNPMRNSNVNGNPMFESFTPGTLLSGYNAGKKRKRLTQTSTPTSPPDPYTSKTEKRVRPAKRRRIRQSDGNEKENETEEKKATEKVELPVTDYLTDNHVRCRGGRGCVRTESVNLFASIGIISQATHLKVGSPSRWPIDPKRNQNEFILAYSKRNRGVYISARDIPRGFVCMAQPGEVNPDGRRNVLFDKDLPIGSGGDYFRPTDSELLSNLMDVRHLDLPSKDMWPNNAMFCEREPEPTDRQTASSSSSTAVPKNTFIYLIFKEAVPESMPVLVDFGDAYWSPCQLQLTDGQLTVEEFRIYRILCRCVRDCGLRLPTLYVLAHSVGNLLKSVSKVPIQYLEKLLRRVAVGLCQPSEGGPVSCLVVSTAIPQFTDHDEMIEWALDYSPSEVALTARHRFYLGVPNAYNLPPITAVGASSESEAKTYHQPFSQPPVSTSASSSSSSSNYATPLTEELANVVGSLSNSSRPQSSSSRAAVSGVAVGLGPVQSSQRTAPPSPLPIREQVVPPSSHQTQYQMGKVRMQIPVVSPYFPYQGIPSSPFHCVPPLSASAYVYPTNSYGVSQAYIHQTADQSYSPVQSRQNSQTSQQQMSGYSGVYPIPPGYHTQVGYVSSSYPFPVSNQSVPQSSTLPPTVSWRTSSI